MDRDAELRKVLERCPWCGGRVQIIQASEPGELTLIACAGTVFGELSCHWSINGADADRAIATMTLKRPA